jgi:hypothetical protein
MLRLRCRSGAANANASGVLTRLARRPPRQQHSPCLGRRHVLIERRRGRTAFALFLPAVLAGYGQATNQTPEFHQGAAGYARYFWHSYVDQAIENYMVEGFGPIITHQDNRYYTLGKGGFLKRTGYALSRAVITRTDAGNETFNSSEIIGAGAAAGISNLYYPSGERTFSNTASKWAINVGADAASFVFKEFWPDVNNALFHKKD